MRRTLFYIPDEIAETGIRVFGPGLLLAAWVLFGVGLLVWLVRRQGFNADTWSYLLLLLLVGAVIRWLLPALCDQHGLPIRGYGVMFLVGVVAGTGLAAWRAWRRQLDPDLIFSLAFWMFVPGIVGARAFYVIKEWNDQFLPEFHNGPAALLGAVVNIAQGGLVVYGGLIGGMLGLLLFVRKFRLPLLATCDLIAPSLVLGLALGRIGCLLNGCCYGDVCELPWAVRFPHDSPPYLAQVARGQITLPAVPIPQRSLPVHPTQVYSSINALLLCLLLLAYDPFRRRDGELSALLISIYPIARFLLEEIRTDEPDFWITGMSISQNVSLGLLICAAGLWFYILRQPRGKAFG